MLSLGLKNAILVLLIILILHVLIKNAIADKKIKEPFQNTALNKADLASLEQNKVQPIKAPACPISSEEKKEIKKEVLCIKVTKVKSKTWKECLI